MYQFCTIVVLLHADCYHVSPYKAQLKQWTLISLKQQYQGVYFYLALAAKLTLRFLYTIMKLCEHVGKERAKKKTDRERGGKISS